MSHALATVRRDGRRPSASAFGNGLRAGWVGGNSKLKTKNSKLERLCSSRSEEACRCFLILKLIEQFVRGPH